MTRLSKHPGSLPIIGIPVDVKTIDNAPYHVVGEKYINAIAHATGCYPILLPAMNDGSDMKSMKSRFSVTDVTNIVDGVFLSGSYSNIHPKLYGKAHETPVLPNDSQRDDFTLELIRICVDSQVPLLAACRGFQEMNVAFGGSIHQEIHEMDQFDDHREKYDLPRHKQYEHTHRIDIIEGGLLHQLHGKNTAMVNSLHGQGLDQLGEGLTIEVTAPDNLVEAISIKDAKSFSLGVQWHPEWRFWEDELSTEIFNAFGQAAIRRHQSR